jgi:putative SOS response-associated peptidase YedK
MCGRFTNQHSWREIWEHYQAFLDSLNVNPGFNLQPRYNIAPTQNVLCVVERHHEARFIEARWGLVPYWASEPLKASTINARAESAADRPLFRAAFKSRRCLIVADGYYEWQKAGRSKQPFRFHVDEGLFSFAGLWAENNHMAITSCAILTLPASEHIAHIHDRMPAILDPEAYQAWISPATDLQEAVGLLDCNLNSHLQYYQVSTIVNSHKNEVPECVQPLGPAL